MAGIPVLMAEGDSIAQAWENALVRLHAAGCDVKTQYDKPDDPPSKDATMIVTVRDPLAEPMIHRDFPGGFEELQEYVMEVCEGIKDHCVRDPSDPADTRWEYTYHQRLFRYEVPTLAPDRPDRARLPAVGRHALHPPRPGDHVEGVGGQFLLRSGLFAEHLVPDHRGRRPAAVEHERPFPLERRLQGGLHEHVRLGPLAGDDCRSGRRVIGQAARRWAATATSPTAFTSTARTWRSSRPASSARSRSVRLQSGRCATRTCGRSWKPPARRFWRRPAAWGEA